MEIVDINKKIDGNLDTYYVYLPHTYKNGDSLIEMNISVSVSSEIEDGILEYQRYEVKSINMFEREYTVDDYTINGIDEDSLDSLELINSIHEMLKENKNTFLYTGGK